MSGKTSATAPSLGVDGQQMTWPTEKSAYTNKRILGAGSTASVQIAEVQGRWCALKVMNLDTEDVNLSDAVNELQMMRGLRHENVLQLYTSFTYETKVYVVMELCEYGSFVDVLRQLMRPGKGLPTTKGAEIFDEVTLSNIGKQVLEGLAYLHTNLNIHRDVKAGNLLLSGTGAVKLGDFGVSSLLASSVTDALDRKHFQETVKRRTATKAGNFEAMKTTLAGTPCWMAPEVLNQKPYGSKADIWSFGITLVELVSGTAPYASLDMTMILRKAMDGYVPDLDNLEASSGKQYAPLKALRKLLKKVLVYSPEKRPTATELLKSDFVKKASKAPAEYLRVNLLPYLEPLHGEIAASTRHADASAATEWDFGSQPDPAGGDDEVKEAMATLNPYSSEVKKKDKKDKEKPKAQDEAPSSGSSSRAKTPTSPAPQEQQQPEQQQQQQQGPQQDEQAASQQEPAQEAPAQKPPQEAAPQEPAQEQQPQQPPAAARKEGEGEVPPTMAGGVERCFSQDSETASLASSTDGYDDEFDFDMSTTPTPGGTAESGEEGDQQQAQAAAPQQQPVQAAEQEAVQVQQEQSKGVHQPAADDSSKPTFILSQDALVPIQNYLKRTCANKGLTPGDYQFNLRARKNDGTKKMFTLTFTINCKTSNALGFSKTLITSGFLRDMKDQMELIRGLDFLINRPEAIAYHLPVCGREDLPPLNKLNINSLPEHVAVILLVRYEPLNEPCKSLYQRAQETKRKEKKHKKLKKEKKEREKLARQQAALQQQQEQQQQQQQQQQPQQAEPPQPQPEQQPPQQVQQPPRVQPPQQVEQQPAPISVENPPPSVPVESQQQQPTAEQPGTAAPGKLAGPVDGDAAGVRQAAQPPARQSPTPPVDKNEVSSV